MSTKIIFNLIWHLSVFIVLVYTMEKKCNNILQLALDNTRK